MQVNVLMSISELRAKMIESLTIFHGSIVVYPRHDLVREPRLIHGSMGRSRVSVRRFLKPSRWPRKRKPPRLKILFPFRRSHRAFFGARDLSTRSHGLPTRCRSLFHYADELIVRIIGSLRKEIGRKVLY